jgi:hypothetical protein
MSIKTEYPERNNDIVCIVATGYAWEDCKFGVPGKDYWCLNNMYEAGVDIHVFDEWFQLHRPGSKEGHVDDDQMRHFLSMVWKKPCWVQADWGENMRVINPYLYPVHKVIDRFCPRDVSDNPYPYFTNSVDYMICLAALRGYKEIQLYGVEFISEVDEEYFKMRQSVNFYVARLTEMGIKVVIQPHSSLLKNSYWYAYESPKRDPFSKIMHQNLTNVQQQKAECEKKIREQEKLLHTLSGGEQTLEQSLRILALKDKGCQI